jgi:hypothetical protein
LGGSDPDEAVLDLEKLQPITLRTLEKYVKSCLTMKPSKTYGALFMLLFKMKILLILNN